ncbi:hypothetical protein BGX20_007542 [Mortierella sp. AD010]|nr:hypothetical protein BGX20_007542 [Mortierella sp. AD010]
MGLEEWGKKFNWLGIGVKEEQQQQEQDQTRRQVLINNTLYITGGTTGSIPGNTTSVLNETLAIDLSQPWSIENPLFTTLAPMKLPLTGHTMNKVPGTTQLLVAGGESTKDLTTSPVLVYQTTANNPSWSTLQLPHTNNSTSNATVPFHRLYHASTTTGKNGILLHGGYLTTVANNTVVSSLVTLKPKAKSNVIEPQTSEPVSLALNPPALARHTMTLTSDGRAIILGGINSQGVLSNLTDAYVMDTQASNVVWTKIPLQGRPPDPRVEFTSVMVNATTLLVYGGTSNYKSAFWVTFYLDLPTWTWSSPTSHGIIPRRWGHTATMVGNIMVVAFGLTSHQTPDSTTVVLLDTTTNTWISNFTPARAAFNPSNPDNNNNNGDGDDHNGGHISTGAVLGIAFVVTAFIVGGIFYLLVRRKKRRTRNTIARENLGEAATSNHQSSRGGIISKVMSIFGLMPTSDGSKRSRSRSKRRKSSDSKRYSDFSLNSNFQHRPASIMEQMAKLGHPTPAHLGYPDLVVLYGVGATPASKYNYPNQACAHTEKSPDGHETQIVFHDFTPGQKEAVRLAEEQERRRILQEQPKSELLHIVDDDDNF